MCKAIKLILGCAAFGPPLLEGAAGVVEDQQVVVAWWAAGIIVRLGSVACTGAQQPDDAVELDVDTAN